MKTSEQGKTLIKEFEGVRLKAYQCSAGVWTIGAGHTGPDVYEGLVIDDAEVERLLTNDLADAEECVNQNVAVVLNQNQFDALVSFVFNCGCGAFRGSTLLRLLNQGDYAGASQQFTRWAKAGGVTLAGLLRRRNAEKELFNA